MDNFLKWSWKSHGNAFAKFLVPTAQGKQGKWPKKNTGNLVCSSCKFPDSKGKRYFEICLVNLKKRFEA